MLLALKADKGGPESSGRPLGGKKDRGTGSYQEPPGGTQP